MATYLVTGGAGFIGSHLCEALIGLGHRVRILDDLSTGRRDNCPRGAELLVGDVADATMVARASAGIDACFHLAAVASVQRGNEDWLGTHRANLTGAVAVFDAARIAGSAKTVPVIYASSAAVYGDNPHIPLAEDAAVRPLSAYGADKLGCELHARVAGHVHGVPTVGFRFFNVYGPRQDPRSPYSGVISIFCDRFRRGAGVTVYGDGGQARDFVYVGDVVRALLAALPKATTEARVFNLSSGRLTTIRDLAATIARLCGAAPRIDFQPSRPGDIRYSQGNAAAALDTLGWRAETELEEGLARTLAALPQPAI